MFVPAAFLIPGLSAMMMLVLSFCVVDENRGSAVIVGQTHLYLRDIENFMLPQDYNLKISKQIAVSHE